MAIKIGINGFGRIGRVVLRILAEQPDKYEVCGINLRKADVDYMVYLLKYDSVFRRFNGTVEHEGGDLVGCTVGVVTAMGSILLLCRLFGLDRAMTMSLLPKSVTMPIATVVSQGHGGTTAITVAAVVVTGMLGNLCAPLLVKLFRVKDPIAVGLGIGACSHAMGTAKALELGETEGAMSGLAIGLCGILTTVLALFAGFFVA